MWFEVTTFATSSGADDAIKGTGLNLGSNDSEEARRFSAFYALSLPAVCPEIKIDALRAEKAGQTNSPLLDGDDAHEELKAARRAVFHDAEEIPSFCDH